MIRRLRTPLARKNLTHDARRLLVALGGIGFAVVLMFMETGFENALFDSALQILTRLDGQLVIVNAGKYSMLSNETFPRERIYQARGCPGVKGVYPLYIESYSSLWRAPGPKRKANPIRVLAFVPGDPVLTIPEINRQSAALASPRTALADRKSKEHFAFPREPSGPSTQRGAELSGQSIRLVGLFQLGTDFANDGNLVMSAANFAHYFPFRAAGDDPLSRVDLAVVHVRERADPAAVAAQLRKTLPCDVKVLTTERLIQGERDFWTNCTPIAYVFRVGTIVGFVVGVIICYQVIYSGISDYMREFATLKAMGYRNRYFIVLVLKQSLYLSAFSFLPGVAVSLILYHALANSTGLRMVLNAPQIIEVFLLTTLMCVVSGCLAIRKVLAADPAELF